MQIRDYFYFPLNDLSKDLKYFLETIFEEVPHEIKIKDLRLLINKGVYFHNDKKFNKLLFFALEKRYVSIIADKIVLEKSGKEKLFELKQYFSQTTNNKTKLLAILSVLIAFLALLSVTVPASPKVYWTQGDSCPEVLFPSGEFSLHLNNYGEVPSLITLNAFGKGINIRKSYSDNDSNMNFSDSFMLPPTSIGGGYSHKFLINVINNSELQPSFNFSYKYTSYFLGFLSFLDITNQGKTFACYYNQTNLYREEYKLIKEE